MAPRIKILFLSTIRATSSQNPTFSLFHKSIEMAANVVKTTEGSGLLGNFNSS
jgi:hypothetical protein